MYESPYDLPVTDDELGYPEDEAWNAACERFEITRAECAQYLLCAIQAADDASNAYGEMDLVEDPQQAMSFISCALGRLYLILKNATIEELHTNTQEFNQIACDIGRLYSEMESTKQLIAKPL